MLYRTAIHEAGHAVIGRAVTMACGGASIVPDDSLGRDGSAGHAVVASVDASWRAWEEREKFRLYTSAVRGRIITVQSGREAEAEILGPSLAWDDDDDDHRVAEALAEDLSIRPEDEPAALARLRRAARQLVRRHRADIETIAGMLMERGTLTGEEIDAALPPGFMARPVTWALALAEVDDEEAS